MATIENFLLRFKVDGQGAVDKAAGSIKGLSNQISQLGANTGPLSGALDGILSRFGPIASAAGAVGAAFVAIGVRGIQLGDTLGDLADATDISSGALLNFRNSVIEAGGKADDFQQIAAKLNQSVQEAAGGNEKFTEAFKRLGVFVLDAEGKVRSTESILRDITDRFKEGRLTGEQYAAAIDLLGKNINKLDLSKLNATGNAVTDEQVRTITKLTGEIDKLKASFDELALSIGGRLAGAFNTAIEAAREIDRKVLEKERELNLQGRTTRPATPPGVPPLSSAPGGLLGFSRRMTAEELEAFRIQELDRVNAAYGPRPSDRAPGADAGAGGYAQSPESIKAAADSARRAQQSILDAQKNATFLGLAEIARIRKQGEVDLQKEISNIQSQEKLTPAQKQIEIEAKRREILSRVALQVANVTEQQDKQLKSLSFVSKAYERQQQLRNSALSLETEFVGKSEDQRQIAEAQRDLFLEYQNTFNQLEQRRQTLGKDEQFLNDEIINQQKELYQIYLDQDKELVKNLTSLQTAKMLEEDRKRNLDNMVKSYDDMVARQQTLASIITGANAKAAEARDAVPSGQLVGLSSLQKQILEIQESNRKAAEEAARSFLAAMPEDMTGQQAQEFARGLDEIAAAYGRVSEAQIAAARQSYEVSTSWSTGWKDAFAAYRDDALDAAKRARDSFTSFTQSMEDAFVRFVQTGKLSFGDLANSILADLARIAVKKAIVAAIGGPLGSLFGFANGGPVMSDTPIVVGERGPELFVPRTAGTIIANNKLGAGSQSMPEPVTVNYNIQAVDAASFRSLVARDPSFIYAVTEKGRQSQPTRRT